MCVVYFYLFVCVLYVYMYGKVIDMCVCTVYICALCSRHVHAVGSCYAIHLIFYVTKATIKDNWSRFQIKQKDEFAPVFNDRKVSL